MKRACLFTIILCWIVLLPSSSQSTPTATLEIKFTGIRNQKGLIGIGINSSPEGWPRKPELEPNWKKSNVVDGVFTARVENLTYGTYAVSVLDDENSNLEMDMFIGIPKEGFGFSNNARVGLSPPKFEECSFILDQPYKQITIDLRYMGKDE
jgi:uncharacterized protein (DUF2141 family)